MRFSSYKDQRWAEKVIIWIVLLNLHGATRSTRFCHNRASLSAWLSFFLQHAGQHRSKNDHDEEIKWQIFYWSCYLYCCERYDNQREESFKRWGKRRIHGSFCYRADCSTAECACSFLPGAVNLAIPSYVKYFFCSLQWVEKVTAQMIPSSSPLVSDMARCSWQVQCECTIARLSPCSLWPFSFSLKTGIDRKWLVNNTSVYFFSWSMFLSFGAWFYEENGQREKMTCTSFQFGMYTKPTAGRPRSAAMPRLVPRQ